MKRRQVLVGLAAGAWIMAPTAPRAQGARVPLIGLLDAGERLAWWAAFRKQMAELGYVEGRNIAFEPRYARGKFERLPALAQELIHLKVDAIATSGSEATVAASRATETIPIITCSFGSHVSLGMAKSLAQPGGNVTGLSSNTSDLTGKRVELMREIFPKLKRAAILWNLRNVGSAPSVREFERVTGLLNIGVQNIGIRAAEDLPEAFSSAVQGRSEVVFVILSPLIYQERRTIGALALKHGLPSMNNVEDLVEAGGMVSYGPSYADLFRRAAFYIDKVLKGEKPGALPIEQPSKFDLVINLKTAKRLKVAIPPAMLARASRVID